MRIGTFGENPETYGEELRREASALDGLISLLQVTHSCSPDQDGSKGIFLCCLKDAKGKERYVNPYTRGEVGRSGLVWTARAEGQFGWKIGYMYYGSSECREMHVQHRPKSKRFLEDVAMGDNVYCLMGCDHAEKLPVIVDLRKIAVCPTHYSLRYGGCFSMQGDWNFDGSGDGQTG